MTLRCCTFVLTHTHTHTHSYQITSAYTQSLKCCKSFFLSHICVCVCVCVCDCLPIFRLSSGAPALVCLGRRSRVRRGKVTTPQRTPSLRWSWHGISSAKDPNRLNHTLEKLHYITTAYKLQCHHEAQNTTPIRKTTLPKI